MNKYDLALKAINEVANEKGSLEDVLDNLQGLKEELEYLIESTEADIEANKPLE